VTSSSPRSAFEQQLCSQLLGLSEVAETLADRVMALEARLDELEAQKLDDPSEIAICDEAGELLLESEEKVRLLRDRLAAVEVIAEQPEAPADRGELMPSDEDVLDQEVVTDIITAEGIGHDDVEYVDDPQIDLMTA